MRHCALVLYVALVGGFFWTPSRCAFAQFDQNYLTNSDFSQGIAGWSIWQERGVTRVDVADGQLHLFGGDGGIDMNVGANGGVYQIVEVTPGVPYQVEGYWQSAPTAPNAHWAEVLVLDGAVPMNDVDVTTGLLWKSDRFGGRGPWDGSFSAASNESGTDGVFTPTSDSISLVLKAGNLDFGGLQGTRFDDIQLLGPAGSFVEPTVTFTGFEGSSNETLGTASTNGIISTANPQVDSQSLMFDNTLNQPTNFHWTSDPVDVSALSDVSLSFAWAAPGTAFENSGSSADSMTFSVLIDGVLTEILALDGDDLDANSPTFFNDGDWYETVTFGIPDSANTIQFQVDALTTGDNEDIFLDDVSILGTRSGTTIIPEPSSLALWGILAAGLPLLSRQQRDHRILE